MEYYEGFFVEQSLNYSVMERFQSAMFYFYCGVHVVTFIKQDLIYKMFIWLTPLIPSTVHVVYD